MDHAKLDACVSKFDALRHRVDAAEEFETRTDPPVSEAQRRVMWAAKSGKSTLGIPKDVGAEFAEADPGGKLPARKDGGPGSGPQGGDRGSSFRKPGELRQPAKTESGGHSIAAAKARQKGFFPKSAIVIRPQHTEASRGSPKTWHDN